MKITSVRCSGCGACYLKCPVQAIEMAENRIGELEAKINENKCVGCNLCKKVCPQNKSLDFSRPSFCFAAWSKNERDWTYSASGGVASVFARVALRNNDYFYGCDYSEDRRLKHFCASNDVDVERMATSKYSQSEAFICFPEIKERLIKQDRVIFIGTPCQVAGLKQFLSNDYDNLITIDLVCHGTPPTKYLYEYIDALRIETPDRIRFRGEFDQQLVIWKNGEIVHRKKWETDLYFTTFYDNAISRNCCYSCRYARPERISDITIGDFWGLGELKAIEKKSNRPSLVLINTEKGMSFFEDAADDLFFEKRSVDEGIEGNGRLNKFPGKNTRAYLFQWFYPLFGFCRSAKAAIAWKKIVLFGELCDRKRAYIVKRVRKFVRNRVNLIRGWLR